MEPGSSPDLLNVYRKRGGQLSKRQGTEVLYEEDGLHSAFSGMQVRTTLAIEYLVCKNGVNLDILQRLEDANEYTRVMQKADVWDDPDSKASMVATNEIDQRVTIATGTNKVVQVRFTEASETVNGGAGSTSASIPSIPSNDTNDNAEDKIFEGLSVSNTLVYVDDEIQSAPTFAWGSGNLVISNLNSFSGNAVVKLVKITWNWFAEAVGYQGNQLYGSTYRVNVKTTGSSTGPEDLAWAYVQTPEDLTYDMTQAVGREYPLALYEDEATRYTHNLNATTYDEYLWTNQAIATTGVPQSSPFGVSFGEVRDTDEITTVGFCRYYSLPFNNNEGAPLQNIAVEFVEGTGTILLYRDWVGHSPTVDPTAQVKWFRCDGTGVEWSAVVLVTNTERTHIGSAANAASDNAGTRVDGNYLSIPGSSNAANYGLGYYPKFVGLVGTRAVLCGATHTPNTAFFSTVNQPNSLLAEPVLNFIDNEYATLSDARAFSITITPDGSNEVVSVLEWGGDVFIVGTESITQVQFAEGRTSQNFNLKTLAKHGAVNAQSAVVTDRGIYYINGSSVYLVRIEQSQFGGYYVVEEIGEPLRDLFDDIPIAKLEETAWAAYVSADDTVYFGIPHESDAPSTTFNLIYHDIASNFFSVWRALGGFQALGGFYATHSQYEYKQARANERLVLAAIKGRQADGTVEGLALLGTHGLRYTDYTRRATGIATETTISDAPAVPSAEFTAQYAQSLFDIADSLSPLFWQPLKLAECNDLRIEVNGEELVHEVDYTKNTDGQAYIKRMVFPGSTVKVSPRRYVLDSNRGQSEWGETEPRYVSPLQVYSDNVPLREGIDCALISTGDIASSLSVPTTGGEILEYGVCYPTWYFSPSFFNEDLSRIKQTTHVSVMFDNRDYNSTYDAGDANSGSGQSGGLLIGRWRQTIGVNIAVLTDNSVNGVAAPDLYGYRDLLFDLSIFDYPAPGGQLPDFVVFREPTHNIGLSYAFLLYSFDDSAYDVVGFQVHGGLKGSSYSTEVT